MPINLAPYQGVFGLPPPTSSVSDDMIRNSMPVLEVTPGEPNFSFGLSLFRINTRLGWTNYTRLLENHGFSLGGTGSTISGKPIKFAFIADNFPTDSFTNEYTETFLQKFTDVASSGLSQIVQMSGAKTASGALKNYGETFGAAGRSMIPEGGEAGILSKALTTGGELMQKASGELKALQNNQGIFGSGMKLVDKMLAGHRIDFPQIWSNSGYAPSYSVTIRLYNPHPRDPNSTLRHIAGPLCVLLCLAVPRSDNGASYRWPFYHKMRVAGLYELNPAVITNITVIKGGDQQQIAFNQALGMVDVRMDFIALHRSMLLEEQHPTNIDRPTVREYIKQLTDDRGVITRAEMNNDNSRKVGVSDINPQNVPVFDYDQVRLERNQYVAKRLPQLEGEGTEPGTAVPDRVPVEEKELETILISQSQEGTTATNVGVES